MRRNRNIARTARSAFTLLELMVSVAILLAVLALIGTIFATASKAGGNATAVTTVYRQLRQAAELIRQDLENMDPSTDVLGVAGVTVPARDSRKNAGLQSWHRADVLMLITDRGDVRPFAFDLGSADPNAHFGDKIQVVYGHADVAALDFTGNLIPGTLRELEDISQGNVSRIPAYEWHLARRTVFFQPNPTLGYDLPLTQNEFLVGMSDVAAATLPYYESVGLFPGGVFHYRNGVIQGCYLSNYTPSCSYRYPADKGWALFESSVIPRDSRWYEWNPVWSRQEWDVGAGSLVTKAPTNLATALTLADLNALSGGLYARTALQFYDGSAAGNRRTVVDPSPPAGLQAGTGAYFLPNCSDFRVEFTFDDPRDVNDQHAWGGGIAGDPLTGGGPSTFTRPIHWIALDPGTQWVWSKITAYPKDPTQTDRWPTAVRITLRAWDAAGRLDEPVTYTLIHTWPSGD